jgi:ribosomal protein S18 acetylase RimI-like enzyme
MQQSSATIEQLTKFSIKDLQVIQQLVAQLGSSYQPLNTRTFKEMLTSQVISIIVARDTKNHHIIGMATVAIYRIPYLKKAYLDDFIIDEKYQGQGIGSQLIKRVSELAKAKGASYLEFTSNPKRKAANKFYEKAGFKKRDTNVYRLDYEKTKS